MGKVQNEEVDVRMDKVWRHTDRLREREREREKERERERESRDREGE